MPFNMRLPVLLGSFAVLLSPAFAGETPWQEIAPGVQLRLISTGVIKPDGTTLLGLEIDMPETTKTYWRVPGDTGLPLELDFTGSTGVTGHKVLWPYPLRQDTEDYLDYVYLGPTILPVEVSVEPGHPDAEISAMLGVCSDICLPAQASFSLALSDAAPDRPNGLRLKQALATTPIAWEDGPEPIDNVQLRADEAMLAVRVSDDTIDPASLIAATEAGEPLFGTPQKSPEPDLVLIPILGKGGAADLGSQDVQLTFMTDMGAFEVTRTVESDAGE